VNKNFKSTDDLNLNRPISPVAELLDSMESENEKDEVLQEDNFKKYDEDDEFIEFSVTFKQIIVFFLWRFGAGCFRC
jgi:hypothetical protein